MTNDAQSDEIEWIAKDILRSSGCRPLDIAASEFVHGFASMIQAHYVIPALVLAYSWIDAMGALSSESGRASKQDFTRWLECYGAVALQRFEIRAIDLYSARCGVVHTLTPKSDLIAGGQAVSIGYATGSENPELLNAVARRASVPARIVHLEDVGTLAFRSTDHYFAAMHADPHLAAKCLSHVTSGFFETMNGDQARSWVRQVEDAGG